MLSNDNHDYFCMLFCRSQRAGRRGRGGTKYELCHFSDWRRQGRQFFPKTRWTWSPQSLFILGRTMQANDIMCDLEANVIFLARPGVMWTVVEWKWTLQSNNYQLVTYNYLSTPRYHYPFHSFSDGDGNCGWNGADDLGLVSRPCIQDMIGKAKMSHNVMLEKHHSYREWHGK